MNKETNSYQKLLRMMDESLTSASDESYIDTNLNRLLEGIGRIFSCGRIVTYEKQPDGSFRKHFEWTNGSIQPGPESWPAETAEKYEAAWSGPNHQDIVEIDDIAQLKDKHPELYEKLKEKGIHAAYFSVIRVSGEVVSFISVENPSWNDQTAMFTVFHICHEIIRRGMQNQSRLNIAEKKGSTDELTGIGNRAALSLFLETLSHEKSLGLVYADVNGLKEENDRHGHDSGDQLLKKTAAILTNAFVNQHVFRIGGDEFLIVCTDLSEDEFHQAIERMKEAEKEQNIVLATGSVYENPWKTDFEVLMRIADSRMYTMKKKWYTDQESRNIHGLMDDDVELAAEIFVNQGLYQVLYRNPAEKGIFPDYGKLEDLVRTCVQEVIYPDDAVSFQSFCNPVLLKKRGLDNDAGSAEMQKEFRISTEDGTWNWVRLSLIVSNADDNDFRILAIARNLSRYNRIAMKYRRLESEAYDFRNEAGSVVRDDDLLRKINLWMSAGNAEKAAFLYFRINHFSLYKSIFTSRQAGQLLDRFHSFLKAFTRDHEGVCGYYGGDEFLAALPVNETDESFVNTLDQWLRHLDMPEGFFPSCGVIIDSHHETPISDLYDRAVLSQDRIHNSHHQLVQLYSGDEFEKLRHETKLMDDLQKDMHNGSMTFYLQPKVNMENGKIVSAEALARWIHDGRIIPPDDYIPLLEREDRIYPLDRYIWDQVFRYQKNLMNKGIRPLPVSVNVSQKDILAGDIAQDFRNLCQKYDLDQNLVNIEITESAYAADDKVRSLSQTLSKDGFIVLMDDFGKGYSSLAMFSSMPVDVLKIDKKFVDQMNDDPKDAEVISLIIRMAHMAGIHVVVEGVETEDQVHKMLSMNCHYAQGYYFYKPMPQDDYESLIRNADNVQYAPNASGRLSVGRMDISELVRSGFLDHALINRITGALSIWELIDEHPVLLQMNEAYAKMMGTSITSISPDRNFVDFMEVPQKEAVCCFHQARKEGCAHVSSGYLRPDTHERMRITGTIYPMNERLNGDLYLVQLEKEKGVQNH